MRLTKLILIIIPAFLLNCSSEKHLKKAIEKHGIKESISFVAAEYPEYFRRDSVIIKDTLRIHDTIKVPELHFKAELADSLNYLVYRSDSLSIVIDKLTNILKLDIKPKEIIKYIEIPYLKKCPPLICPDIPPPKDSGQTWKYWIAIIFEAFVILLLVYPRKK